MPQYHSQQKYILKTLFSKSSHLKRMELKVPKHSQIHHYISRMHVTYLICMAGHARSLRSFCSDPVSLLFTSWQHKFMCHKVSCASINGNDLCHVRMMTTLGSLYDNTHRDWTDGATITSSPNSPSLCSAVNRNRARGC